MYKFTRSIFMFGKNRVNESFLDKTKFKDSLYLIYESSESRTIKLFNGAYLTLLGYNVFTYMQGAEDSFDKSQKENSAILLGILGVGMILFNLKISYTLRRLWIGQNGRQTYIEIYRTLGFRTHVVQVDNKNFNGVSYFGFPSLFRIPYFKVFENISGKKHKVFFKSQYITDKQTMHDLLLGKDFIVATEQMHINLSGKQKKKLNI